MKAKWAAIAAIGIAMLPAMVSGQRSVRLAVGGGIATPVGKSGDAYRTSGSILGGVAWGSDWSFLGARFDYSANRFNGKTPSDTVFKRRTIPAVTASVILSLPVIYVKPYVLVGPGWYPLKEAKDTKVGNDFGIAGGGGVTFPFFIGSGFIEARYHNVMGRKTFNHFVPVTAGFLI